MGRRLKKKNTQKKVTKRQTTSKQQVFDKTLFAVISGLSIWGAIMVYSGSVLVAARQGKNPYHFFMLQTIWVLLGSIGGYITFKIDYKILPKLAVPGLAVTYMFLILVLLLNWDQAIKRWIALGPFSFQPSELAKLVFLIYLSGWLAKSKKISGKTFREMLDKHVLHEMLPFLLLLGAICLPILIQPDLDTTIMLATTSFLVYFIAGTDLVHFLTSISLSGIFALLGFGITKLASYRVERLSNWWQLWVTNEVQNPYGSGYQLRQILVAVASGGIFGVGFGESRQKFHYLGETAFTDTIFAIFAEEFGLVGSAILILIYLYIFLRGIKIAQNSPDKLGFLLALSITIWITLQSFMHIASNVALIPINGNTLPFLSYGGSSTLINLTAIGVLLNISKHNKTSTSTSRKRRS